MNDLTQTFAQSFHPIKAIVFYKNERRQCYIEAFDMLKGCPTNAHPFTDIESADLADLLQSSGNAASNFLSCKGMLPKEMLSLRQGNHGHAVWWTRAQKVDLFFSDDLSIPSGKGYVPPLIWKATADELYLFAFKENKRPTEKTKLYKAPFFNGHPDGRVCMGTVTIDLPRNTNLVAFKAFWEKQYFGSYFSHLILNRSPVNGNIIQLWKEQIDTNRPFPTEMLTTTLYTLKSILP